MICPQKKKVTFTTVARGTQAGGEKNDVLREETPMERCNEWGKGNLNTVEEVVEQGAKL